MANNNNNSKTINLSKVITVRTWLEPPSRCESEKNLHKVSSKAELEQFVMVLFAKKNIQYQCPHSKLFPGFRA